MNARLLILDLDETLIHGTQKALERPADFQAGRYHIYRRPHLEAFLTGCFSRFKVAVWTSASPDYADAVVRHIFPNPEDLVFLWAGDRCTRAYDPETCEHYSRKRFAKLRRVRRRNGWGLGDVLAVDDSPEKWQCAYGNYIRVAPFEGDPQDMVLPQLLQYLGEIALEPDFRAIEKRGWHSRTI